MNKHPSTPHHVVYLTEDNPFYEAGPVGFPDCCSRIKIEGGTLLVLWHDDRRGTGTLREVFPTEMWTGYRLYEHRAWCPAGTVFAHHLPGCPNDPRA